MLLLFLFSGAILSTSAEVLSLKPKMVLFQGTVNPIEICVNQKLTNTTQCAIICAKKLKCLLTVMKHKECIHCDYNENLSWNREAGDTWIALKVSNEFEYVDRTPTTFNFSSKTPREPRIPIFPS